MPQTKTNMLPVPASDWLRPHQSLCIHSASTFNYFVQLLIITIFQDGWRRLEHEKVMAPAPDEKSGAGVVGGEESGKLHQL
jgi:hypothetical protein